MIKLPETLLPGVYTRTSIRAAGATAAARLGAAAVGRAGADYSDLNAAVLIETAAQADAFGAGSPLAQMTATLLDAGVSPLWAVAAGEDYTPAFAAVRELRGIRVVISDGGADVFSTHIDSCVENADERVGLLAVSAPNKAAEAAAALNNAHIAVVCDGGTETHRTAAAFGAAVTAVGAGGSFSGLAVPFGDGFDGALTRAEIHALLEAGVTPFATVGSRVECVRAVTTRTRSGGVYDRTLASLSATLAADEVVGSVRNAVRARLRGLKNNGITRESIASQITVELEAKQSLGVIDSYLPPSVETHPQDPGICVATLRFQVAPELNQIVITAEILV